MPLRTPFRNQVYKGAAIVCIVSLTYIGFFHIAITFRTSTEFLEDSRLPESGELDVKNAEGSGSPTQEYVHQAGGSGSPRQESVNRLLKVLPAGENIQVGSLELHVTTAAEYSVNKRILAHAGLLGTLTGGPPGELFLNGWMRHGAKSSFKCCLTKVTDGHSQVVQEVDAALYHEYDQWRVEMQAAEFVCDTTAATSRNYDHVTFAETSCPPAPPVVMPVVRPPVVPGSMGICLKISYGTLNASKVVEWMEFQRLLNVTRVFTYYHDLDPDVMRVFRHYQKTGFLETYAIHPAIKKGGKPRHFRLPRWEEQCWVDEVMAANDCKHRMAGFDYVIVMDMDELVVPAVTSRQANPTLHSVLKETSFRMPDASAFSFNSYVNAVDWGKSDLSSPLFFLNYINRTSFVNYDGADRNTRWAFKPKQIYYAQNNAAWPSKGFKQIRVPQELYSLYHYRKCKTVWKHCANLTDQVRDTRVLRHTDAWMDRVQALPLEEILADDKLYVGRVRDWTRVRKAKT